MGRVVKDPARNTLICDLRRAGAEPAAIASRMGLSRNTVLGVLYRAGLTEKNREVSSRAAYTPAFRARVLDAHKSIGVMAASKRWSVATSTISSWARGL